LQIAQAQEAEEAKEEEEAFAKMPSANLQNFQKKL